MKKFLGILALALIACLVCTGLAFAEEDHEPIIDRYVVSKDYPNTFESTCTAEGLAIGICKICGQPHDDAKYVTTPPLGHELGEKPIDTKETTTKEATCTEIGYKTVTKTYKCIRCNYTSETSEEIEIPATGHKWSEEKREIAGTEKPATCEEPAKVDKAFVCTNGDCKAINEESRETVDKGEKLGHDAGNPVEENKVEATCAKNGSVDKVTYCKRCYKELERVTEVIPMTEKHTPGTPEQKNFVDSTCVSEGGYDLITYCTVCGKELEKEHKVIKRKEHGWEYDKDNPENLKPGNKATCYSTGKEYGYCSVCGEKNLEKETKKLDHNYGPEVTVPATCSAPGRKLQECQNEGCTEAIDGHYKIIETYPIDANAHKWVLSYDKQADPESVTRPATCTKHGVNAYVCEYNKMHRYAVQTDPLGHDEFVLPAIEPTCKDPGFAADGIMCKRGEKCDGKEVEWPKGYPAEVKEEYKDYKLIKAPTTIPAKGHIKLEIISDTATCTKDGLLTYRCARCGAIVNDEKSPAKKHDWFLVEEAGEPADCIHGGYQSWRCHRCQAEKKVEIPATGEHQFGEPYMIEPTCKTAGREARVCEVCFYEDVLKFLPINPDNHDWQINWENLEKVPTCTEAGLGEEICSICKQKRFGTIDPLGHDEKYIAEQKPTCTETGLTAYSICRNCGEVVVKPTVIPALGHTPGEPVKENVIEPTETEPGSYDEVIYCTVCEAELSREKKEIPLPKNGLAQDEEGKWHYYKDDEIDTTKTGIVEFQGGEFWVVKGDLAEDANGLTICPDGKAYFLVQGQIQKVSQVAEYQGNWFMIKDGLLDESANGLYDYDGGKFVFAAGKLRKDVNGLWLNPKDDKWYFLANGQVQNYSGVAEYDGEFFLLKNGVLDSDYNGTITYDGKTFNVVNGQLYDEVA